MKLTEPQERTLRMMRQYKMHVSVHVWDDGYWQPVWVTSDPSWPRSTRHPNVRAMQALEHKGLLRHEPEGTSDFRFVLTPRGREVAKELQGETV